MNLRLWRKTKRFNHPGNLPYKKANPWHTRSLNPKTKKFFSKNQKLYSSELRSSVFISAICQKASNMPFFITATNTVFKGRFLDNHTCIATNFNQSLQTVKSDFSSTQKAYNWNSWRNQNWELSPMLWRSLFYSRFWVFNYPIAVPGAVKVRRSKHLFTLQKNAMHNFQFFMHRVNSYWLKQLYMQNTLMHKTATAVTLIKTLERFWPTLVYKIRLAPTMIRATRIMSQNLLVVNGFHQTKAKSTAIPADCFTLGCSLNQNSVFPMLPIVRFQGFHKKMFKNS